MAETFRLEIASPERMLVNEAVTDATIPGEQGMLGILPGHAPLLSELGTGELTYNCSTGNGISWRCRAGMWRSAEPRPRGGVQCRVRQ